MRPDPAASARDALDLAGALAHAALPAYARRLARTRALIVEILERAVDPWVSWSAGKDSQVLAHLVLAEAPGVPLRILTSGETRLLHPIDPLIDWWRARGAAVEETCIDRVWTPEWSAADWDTSRHAGRHDLQRHGAAAGGWVFVGLRQDESPRRRRALRHYQSPDLPAWCYRYVSTGQVRACPLAQWTQADVAAYIASHGIPLLEAYREEGMDARTTMRLTGASVRLGTLRRLRDLHPDRYLVLTARWPELEQWT